MEDRWLELPVQLSLGYPDIQCMARGQKSERKRDNPDFHSSSFYVRKDVNHHFDMRILELKLQGHTYDRSDVLELLMKLFIEQPHLISERQPE